MCDRRCAFHLVLLFPTMWLVIGCTGRHGFDDQQIPDKLTIALLDSESGPDIFPIDGADPDAVDQGSLPEYVGDADVAILEILSETDGSVEIGYVETHVEVQKDVEPVECKTAGDCPATGAEPCFVASCEPDENSGLLTCHLSLGLQCESTDPCLDSMCVVAQGCVEISGSEGVMCDDENQCTSNDKCHNGLCLGQMKSCDDDNFCTADMCDGATGECFYLNIPTDCDDGNPCTVGDECLAGNCAPGEPAICDDFNACTVEECDPVVGECVFEKVEGCCLMNIECIDDDLCTSDVCQNLECSHYPIDCDDSHPCTVDGCVPDLGCTHDKIPLCCVVDADCDDSDLCTQDACIGGKCSFAPNPPCKDTNPCTTDTCDPGVGCVFLPVSGCCLFDSQCDDDDLCTEDWCKDNACQHKAVACEDGNKCTFDSCDPLAGCVFPQIPDCCLSDLNCDDGNLCTQDWCSGEKCQHKPVECLDNDVCTQDSCLPDSGCSFLPVPGCCYGDSDCQVGNQCTVSWCDADNQCVDIAVDCDDGDACTTDQCDPQQGCVYSLVVGCCTLDLECDDGDPCTHDTCKVGKCLHEPKLTPECCSPDCLGKACGPDGCGGMCGFCEEGFCNEDTFSCEDECISNCVGKECGPDGCGTFCGLCPDDMMCDPEGQCVDCVPNCAGKECGPDGCDGSCGLCPEGDYCQSEIGMCVPACTCIGASCYQDGFESGGLSGWSFDGDAEVIHNMGVAEAPQGWYMAFVGSGLSDTELGKLKKSFCPKSGQKWFGFKWKHYSAEFKEWCGSIYQDTFIVTIDNGFQQIELIALTIDDLCPPEECGGCGEKYIGIEPADVEFDYPDVWTTPWSTAFFELPEGFTDHPVTVTFEVSDVGDMVYVTAILIDAVQFL